MAGFGASSLTPQGPKQGDRYTPPGGGRTSVYLNGKYVDPESTDAEGAAPRYRTDPGTGIVDQYNPYSMQWTTLGQMGNGASASRGSSNAAAAGTGQFDTGAIQGLISQLSTPAASTYTAAQTPVTTAARGDKPYEMAAEDQAFGAAKSRMAGSVKAALRSMNENLAARGVYGSSAGALGEAEIRSAGLSQLSGVNNALAEGRSQRAFTSDQADTDRVIGQNQYNVGAENQSRQFNAQDTQRRQSSLASLLLALKGGRY